MDGVTWGTTGRISRPTSRTCIHGSIAGATGRGRRGGRTSRSQMGGSGRSESPRWRTRSCSGRWSRCCTPYTRRTSWASRTGFGPGVGRIDALDALAVGIEQRKVNWVLDADIRGFFDSIDHEWMLKFLEHRIADQRVLRLIRKWLNAGVIEHGEWSETPEGTPQGASASPLLSNVYLHYVFDLWAHQWRRRNARGDVVHRAVRRRLRGGLPVSR